MSYLPWFIWIAPIIGALLTPAFAKISPKLRNSAAVGFSLLAALAATATSLTVASGDYQVPWIPSVSSASRSAITAGVLVDPLSMFMADIVAWVSFLIMVYSVEYMKGESGLTRYWFFMNLFIGNMLLLILADNLLMMLFGWEGVGLCSYALIGFWYRDEKEHWVGTPGDKALGLPQEYSPSQAGMKAFIFTRIGDIALMIAIFLIYAYAGTFNYVELATKVAGSSGWAAGLARLGLLVPTALLFFGGPIGKSAQFPLQEWLPDAMAGPTSVSALIHAATMVKAGVFLTGRMGPIFYAALVQFNQVLPFFATVAWIGAATAFLAATQATVAREIKKVLAYSTVSQIGYMMLGLGVAGLGANFALGYTAGLFHVMSHAIFKASLFLAAGWVIHATESRFMDEMGGLAKGMRLTAAAMLLAGLSLMGIPPLSGFWTKDAVLSASFDANQYLLYGLGLVTVLLTGFYTMRMLGMTFSGKHSSHVEHLEHEESHVHEAHLTMLLPYFLLAAASLAIGVAFPLIDAPLTNYLRGTFVFLKIAVPSGASSESSILSTTLVGVSVAVALAGAALGYIRYFNKEHHEVVKLGGLQGFLWNRWYLNAIYYKVFVNGAMRAANGLYQYVERGLWDPLSYVVARDVVEYSKASRQLDERVVDGAINEVSTEGSRLSNIMKRFQTGVTQQYVITFAIGIFLLLAYMIFVIGAI